MNNRKIMKTKLNNILIGNASYTRLRIVSFLLRNEPVITLAVVFIAALAVIG